MKYPCLFVFRRFFIRKIKVLFDEFVGTSFLSKSSPALNEAKPMNWRERRQRRELTLSPEKHNHDHTIQTDTNEDMRIKGTIEREIEIIPQNLPSILVTPPCEAVKTFPLSEEIVLKKMDPTRIGKDDNAGYSFPLNPIIHVKPYVNVCDSDDD